MNLTLNKVGRLGVETLCLYCKIKPHFVYVVRRVRVIISRKDNDN